MAQEIRKLEFSLPEVENALRVFCAKTGQGIPQSVLIRMVSDPNSSSRFSAFFQGDQEIQYPLRDKDILTALLVFCQQSEIPVPKSGQKIVKAEGEKVILYIRHG
ncbi:hypothetical protein [Terasakiella pusilla]|jgi:hypothetical protein|uniref:hypothetical protein n=1 Tax=Terasakiella pusilla TaxID=64973 RepID=UPI00048F5C61|nr:hypothetical protein [Terasakiella pusilla]